MQQKRKARVLTSMLFELGIFRVHAFPSHSSQTLGLISLLDLDRSFLPFLQWKQISAWYQETPWIQNSFQALSWQWRFYPEAAHFYLCPRKECASYPPQRCVLCFSSIPRSNGILPDQWWQECLLLLSQVKTFTVY